MINDPNNEMILSIPKKRPLQVQRHAYYDYNYRVSLHAQLFLIGFNYFYRDSFLHSHMIRCIIIMRATFFMSMHIYYCYHTDLELYINLNRNLNVLKL